MGERAPHTSVMLGEVLSFFEGRALHTFCEGTVGAGGHAEALLMRHPEMERYIAIDRDLEALSIAKKRLERWKGKVEFVHANFEHLDEVLKERGVREVDGFFLIWGSRRCSWHRGSGDLAF